MPVVKERLKKVKQKHSDIIRAAIKVFAKKGFHDTKVSDIAKAAKIGDGTVYLYFKNKDEILISCLDELIDSLLNYIFIEVDKVEDSLEKIHKFIEIHIDFLHTHPNHARLLMIELRQSSEFYHKYPNFSPMKRYLSYLTNLCSKAIEYERLRMIDPEILTTMIFGTMDFVLMRWLLDDYSNDLNEVKAQMADILGNGVLNKTGDKVI